MGTKGKKKKAPQGTVSQEEWDVRYDILHNTLWIVLKQVFLLNIVWFISFLVIGQGDIVANFVKVIPVPLIMVIAANAFEFFFLKYHLPINDGVIMGVLNVVVFLIVAGDRWTHTLMMVCLLPLIYGLIIHKERLIYLQIALSLAGMLIHYAAVEMSPDGALKGEALLNISGLVFDVFLFATLIIQLRKYTNMLDTQTTIDSLTRLHNHESFYEELDRKLAEYGDPDKPLSILIADIDNFKKVNDTYGHAYGDRVLKVLADIFAAESSKKCFVSRYGGEEFAMIMELDRADAITKAQTIRKHFEQAKIPTDYGAENSFTVSVGVAVYVPEYETSSQFFEKADEALYKAKASGKNRVCL